MEIRDYVFGDYERIIALWTAAGLGVKANGRDSRGELQRQLHTGCVFILVAEHDNRIVGTLLGSHDARKGWINRLAVDDEYRRAPLGVAVRLLEECERRFLSLGLEIFVCLIEGHSEDSMRLFRRMGYLPFGDVAYYTKRLRPDI